MERRQALNLASIGLLTLALAGGWLASAASGQGPDRVLLPAKVARQDEKPAGRSGKPLPPGWRLLDPVRYENLSVFPVVTREGIDTSAFLTLDEGLSSGQVIVAESGSEIIRRSQDGRPIRGGGAQVNQLVLVNRSAKPLVLLAGEVVTGGKQDRVIAKDRIVPPGGDPLPLDVFCVERGRWSGAGGNFNASKMIVHPSVREKAAVEQKQDEVWASVRKGSTHSSADAATPAARQAPLSRGAIDGVVAAEAQSESYGKIYQSRRVGQSVETFAAEVERRFTRATAGLKGERVIGVVIAYGGEVAWADAFASGALFEKYWPKLLRSYVVEALARPNLQERATLDDATDFLTPVNGRVNEESEPGVYKWRQITLGRYAEIELESLAPKTMTLHWMKLQRNT
jgi:hypothetical protein